MANKEIFLSARLQMIVSLVPFAQRIIDVGSDHGLVLAYLLEHNKAPTGLATDIRSGPLGRTSILLRERGLEDCAKTLLTDGLESISLRENDVVIIAGMGGLEMCHILENALMKTISDRTVFIFQPQKNLPEFRDFLYRTGFVFQKEKICEDRGLWYTAICGIFQGKSMPSPDLTALYLGPCLLLEKPEKWREYLLYHKEKLSKISRGKKEYLVVLQEVIKQLQDFS